MGVESFVAPVGVESFVAPVRVESLFSPKLCSGLLDEPLGRCRPKVPGRNVVARVYIHVYDIPYDMCVLTALRRVCAAPLRLARRAAWALNKPKLPWRA